MPTIPRNARPSRSMCSWFTLALAYGLTIQACFCALPANSQIEAQHFRSDLESTTTNENRLRWLVQHAGVIFSGQVISIHRSLGAGWVQVNFRVDTALRGVRPGSFQLRSLENAPGSFPLRQGEQIVIFLHAPNEQKNSSVVGGHCGLLPGNGAGKTDLRGLQFCPPQLTPETIRLPLAMHPADLQRLPPHTEPLAIPLAAEPSSIATSDLLVLLSQLIDDSRATAIRQPVWDYASP